MKNRTPENSHRLRHTASQHLSFCAQGTNSNDVGGHRNAIRKTRQRYCTLALTMAILVGAVLMLFGYPALGKGLILGALFSILNFILMAIALPMRIGKGRGTSIMFSLGSLYIRFALMALPLVWAIKQDAFALPAVATGLFMIQIAIMGDHLLGRWRNLLEAG